MEEGGSERAKAGKGGCSHLDLLHFHWWGVKKGVRVCVCVGGVAPRMDQYVDLLEGGELVVVVELQFFSHLILLCVVLSSLYCSASPRKTKQGQRIVSQSL